MKTTSFAAVLGLSLVSVSTFAQAPSTTTTVITEKPAAAPSTEVGVSSRDGITVSGASALVTRNGVTETLTKELELPNRLRVQPDGTIVTPDGGTMRLRASQVLTFEGKLIDSPVMESVAPKTTSATTTTTTTTAPAPATIPAPVTTTVVPTIVIQKPAVTNPNAEQAAQIEADRRARAGSNERRKAGEGAQR